MDIRFLGHSAFTLSDGDTTVLIDPFLTGNPKAAVAADDLNPTTILLSRGHADHYGDTVQIAKRSGAEVIALTEIAGELEGEGLQVSNPSLGGTVTTDWGSVKMVPAWHTSTTANGTINTPAGLLIKFADTVVYHLGDTCLFSDLQLVGRRTPIDVALMPIADRWQRSSARAFSAASWTAGIRPPLRDRSPRSAQPAGAQSHRRFLRP